MSAPAPTLSRTQVEEFLYLEARLADENDYDGWEALWTDDALYWVPAADLESDPLDCVSIVFDNRNRISTRLKQLRTGKRYAQAPASVMRRQVTNIEILGTADNGDTEVGANFLLIESRMRGVELWGGRVTYRLRETPDGLRLSYKKVLLVNHDKVVPTLGFLI